MRPATAALAAGLLLAACATDDRPPPPTQTAPQTLTSGYLDEAAIEAIAAGFAAPRPAPAQWPGDAPGTGPGADRWWLAIAHAELRPPVAAQHFDCLLGTRLDAQPRPALTRLMGRLMIDAGAATRRLAERHPRPRPVAVQPDLQPCQRLDAAGRDSPSWPAGGAAVGTAYGEMFAALAPDQADALRLRGSEIGRSRVICRTHWPDDVDAGLHLGRRVWASASAAPDFAADLEAARAELAAAREEGLTNPACAAERRALGLRPDAG